MELAYLPLMDGASRARGTAVVIDVFRAATTAAYVLANGADCILIARSFRDAFDLKKKNPDYILVGENHGLPVKGFDYGNSPSKICGIDFSGKIVVMKTSSGTSGILKAKEADVVLFAGYVNASATAGYIKRNKPAHVSLVPMGWEGKRKTEEDEMCARYIGELLVGNKPRFEEIKKHLRYAESSRRFFSGKPDWPEQDFYCAMELDCFPWAMKAVRKEEGMFILKA